jgi:very-short-patch-repair endonuclease
VFALDAEVDRLSTKGRVGLGALRRYLDDRALGAERPDGLLEPRMARLLRKHGLPPAVFQHRVYRDGRHVGRIDFAWPDLKIAIEVDGWEKRATPERMSGDHERQAELAGLGWVVVRFTWEQVVRRPAWVAEQLRAVRCARASTCRR